jgi:hypothetical protein
MLIDCVIVFLECVLIFRWGIFLNVEMSEVRC